jgi:DNA repair protein RadC
MTLGQDQRPVFPWEDSPADHELPRAFEPRGKLLSRGPRALSQAELLALVLGSGRAESRGSTLARRLVHRHGLRGLAERPLESWRADPEVGPATVARLVAVFELARRAYGVDSQVSRPRLNGPRQVFRQVRRLARAKKEHLIGLYLDAQNGLIHRETISIGSLNTTRTHPREILFPAVSHLAIAFILVHNHPSGCPDPSPEDLDFTRYVRRASEMMGIELYDHLIVAGRGYTSFRERGLL